MLPRHVLEQSLGEELQKIAFGATPAVAGAVGGLGSAYMSYQGARNEGKGVGDSLLQAGKSGLVGAGVGAATGAGIGLAAKHLPAGRIQSAMQSASDSIGNFGKRQVHAITGYVPSAHKADPTSYLRSICVGTAGTQEVLDKALAHQKKLRDAPNKGFFHPLRQLNADWNVYSARASHDSNETFLRHQATSLPGLVRAFGDSKARPEVLKAVGKDLAFGGGALGTAMMVPGAVSVYNGLAGKQDPYDQQPRGRGEVMGRAIGSGVGYFLPSPIPMAGQVVGSDILGGTLGAVGRGVDKVLGNKPMPRPVEASFPYGGT